MKTLTCLQYDAAASLSDKSSDSTDHSVFPTRQFAGVGSGQAVPVLPSFSH